MKKVIELIKELEKMDPDKEIFIFSRDSIKEEKILDVVEFPNYVNIVTKKMMVPFRSSKEK